MIRKSLFLLTFITLLICTPATAQDADWGTVLGLGQKKSTQNVGDTVYLKQWQTVDSLNAKGLLKSADSAVSAIAQQAKKEGQYTAYIKALLIGLNYETRLTETNRLRQLQRLDAEIAQLPAPHKNILQSITGSAWLMAKDNSYDDESVAPDTADPNTWSNERLYAKAQTYFEASLQNAETFGQYPTQNFAAIIQMPNGSAQLCPSLRDVLYWRAFDFYKQLAQNLYIESNFTPKQVYCSTSEFLSQQFTGNNYQQKAFALLQTLLSNYQKEGQIRALVAADMLRVEYAASTVYDLMDRETLLIQWLENQLSQYKNHPVAAELLYKIAERLAYTEEYSYYRYDNYNNLKAAQYCQWAIDSFADEKATTACRGLLKKIKQPRLRVAMQKTNMAKQAFKYKITYKNLRRAVVKFIAINPDTLSVLTARWANNREGFMQELLKYPVTYSEVVRLPADTTYTTTTTAWYNKGLPAGHYVMLASANVNFLADTNAAMYTSFWCTDYMLYTSKTDDNKFTFYVTSAKNNKPVKNARLLLQYYNYNDKENASTLEILADVKTNAQGMAIVEVGESKSIKAQVFVKGKMVLATSDYLSNYSYNGNTGNDIYVYTDRDIYRPGQTIYFKGIVAQHTQEGGRLITNTETNVTLEDPNGEIVAEGKYTTNSFGSFSGSFTIPYGRITGYYYISTPFGGKGVSVEEYKRPKFEIIFDTLKTNPAFNDTVVVSGKAAAFAGNSLNGAKLTYRVSRQKNYMYFWNDVGTENGTDNYNYWEDAIEADEEEAELKTGTLLLGDDGTFTISYIATQGKNPRITYTYEVTVSVTDITGEVQTSWHSTSIGKRSVYAYINANANAFANTPVKIGLRAENPNSKAVPVQGTFSIQALQTPKNIFIDDELNRIDTQLISYTTHKKLFPYYAYNNEDQKENYPKGQIVYTQEINNAGGYEEVLWQAQKQPSGLYVLTFTYTDNLGKSHTETSYMALLNTKAKKAFAHSNFDLAIQKRTFQPGETAEVWLSSRFPSNYITYYIERQGKVGAPKTVKLKNKLLKIKIPITEADRGGVHITAFTVFQNQFYQASEAIYVPYTNKKLNVEVTSYRDKMTPGGKEEWQLKITGANAQKVSAEVLASMYDASLDKIQGSHWYNFTQRFHKNYSSKTSLRANHLGTSTFNYLINYPNIYYAIPEHNYPRLYFFKWMPDLLYESSYDWSDDWQIDPTDSLGGLGLSGGGYGGGGASEGGSGFGRGYGSGGGHGSARNMYAMKAEGAQTEMDAAMPAMAAAESATMAQDDEDAPSVAAGMNLQDFSPAQFIKVRRNLDETAFFFAHQQTDDSGIVIIKFIAPEALTRWNFRALAYTQDFSGGMLTLSSITQKPLMVQTNMPRFLREGDEIYINAKVVNLSGKELSPNATLEIYDAATGKNIPEFNNTNAMQIAQLGTGVSQSVKWKVKIPAGYGALKIVVKAYEGKYTDAEANTLPVLSSKVLVTEALPITFSGNQPKSYTLEKLKQSGSSTTLSHHKLTVEFTPNPAWYAIQALPYMMEYSNECAEQVFNRWYANILAAHIAQSNPKIRDVFESWKATAGSGEENSFMSNLQKNQELKTLLLQETPWLVEGNNERERLQRLGQLFDVNNINNQTQAAFEKLNGMQNYTGSFAWFKGMGENRTLTQYIVAGIGRLAKLQANVNSEKEEQLLEKALEYAHQKAVAHHGDLVKREVDLNANHLDFEQIQYLYAASFFALPDNDAVSFGLAQAKKYWQTRNHMEKAMLAIVLHRTENTKEANAILASLRQTAIVHPQNGMYWKQRGDNFNWADAPIETQSLIIEAFAEITTDTAAINQMRTWLLKQKQLTDWKTTRATADACYALLLNGTNWLATDNKVSISVAGQTISTTNAQAGTGYIKTDFAGAEIKPNMATLTITPQTSANIPMAWGGLYWQYFEQLDKITYAQSPLSIAKLLFVEQQTDSGVVQVPLSGQKLKTGDKIIVRLLLKANNAMEYVHLKDMRAAALEPSNSLSGYQWQNGVGYYQSMRDASANFFFDKLPKGQWVFEYEMYINQAGTFQNGIATVQSMYAPEYTAHSNGVVIEVEP